jgi:hypothetical protein
MIDDWWVFCRYDPDGHVELVYEGIGVSNGIGFSPDNKIMCELTQCRSGCMFGIERADTLR